MFQISRAACRSAIHRCSAQTRSNETRFQYIRAHHNQTPHSTDPTITVAGAFTGGGSNAGVIRDNQDRFELENYTTAIKGPHSMEFGGRFRLTRDASSSTSGFNGNYIYTSLASYAAKTPSEYDITVGNANTSVSVFDAGLFFQDDYKLRPNLTSKLWTPLRSPESDRRSQ
jgi:hypothetical protein